MMGIFDTVIDPKVHQLAGREKELLVELRELLDAEQMDDRRHVDDLLTGLGDLFNIVVVGEFNAGKSSVINALFGSKLRVEGPVPVDDKISILRFGERPVEKSVSDFIIEQTYPVEFLKNITLIDTPGTNSIVKRHQEITEQFVPRADLILFTTSIDRPLSESERAFLQFIREWGKKVVFVLNKIDTKTDAEIREVTAYLEKNINDLFGFAPAIFPVAAKPALAAKSGQGEPHDWTASRFEDLENYIFKVLSEKERIRIKLQAPLDTVLSLTRKIGTLVEARRELLVSDLSKIQKISDQLVGAERDLLSNFSQFITRLDNLMMQLERRGVEFLERYIRIGHLMLLRDSARFRDEFERQVFAGWQGSVDKTIQESVDWLVKENMKLWNSTVEVFHQTQERDMSREVLVGKVGREFAYNREEVYSRIKTEAEQRMRTYDIAVESRRMIDSAMQGVFHSVGLSAGALGLGYMVTTLFTSVAIDVTGLTAAVMLLAASFFILPYKRSKAKREFAERIEQVRQQLKDALSRESANEIQKMTGHVSSAFEPYKRFYETESEKIRKFSSRLVSIEQRARGIASEITTLA